MTAGQDLRQPQAPARQRAGEYLWSSPAAARPRRMPGAVVFLLAVALIGAVGMLYLLQTNHVANLGYEMSQLQNEREAALIEQQQLSAQIAEKQALMAVDTTARIELGMRPMDDYVFVDVDLPPAASDVQADPPAEPRQSRIGRFWDRLTGKSTASESVPASD